MLFEKGKSGNPNGRPKRGKALSDHIRAILAEVGEDGISKGELFAQTVVRMSLEGHVGAMAIVLDRIEGKVPDATKHGGTVTIRVVRDAR